MIAGIEITQLIWYPESTRELEETHNPLPIQIKMPPGACIEAARAWPLGKMQRISLRYTLPLHSWDRTQQALQLSCQHSWCADTYNFALNYESNFTNKSKYNSQIGYTANAILFFFFSFLNFQKPKVIRMIQSISIQNVAARKTYSSTILFQLSF